MIDESSPYEVSALVGKNFKPLQQTFEDLPPDPYADDRLRSRRYSRFLVNDDGALRRLSHKEFMQSSAINDYVGDVDREYEEIEDRVMEDPVFVEMFHQFIKRTGMDPKSIVEAHQIRWHCNANIKVPAPEGHHQDGFDFIAMFMVNQKNVDGGEIMVMRAKDAAPIFKKRLEAGEYVVLDDSRMFHNAAPLVPSVNSDGGFWDLIVLTGNDQAYEEDS